MNGFRHLEDHLRRFQVAAVRHALKESLVLWCICALIWSTCLLLLSQVITHPQILGPIGLLGLAVLGALSLYVRFWKSRRSLASLHTIALQVEQSLDHGNNEIITALQWGNNDPESIDESGLSSLLVRELLARSTELASKEPDKLLINTSYIQQVTRVGSALLAVVVFSVILAPSSYESGLSRIIHGPPVSVELAEEKIMEVDVLLKNVTLSLVHPAYSRIPPRTITGSSGDIAALAGTAIKLTGESVHSMTLATLTLSEGEAIPLKIGAEGRAEANWILMEEDTYRVEGEQEDGTKMFERGERAMDVLPDHKPVVKLMAPDEDQEVNLEDQVKFIYHATDDYGLSQIELVVQNHDGGEPYRSLVQRLDSERLFRGTTTFDIRDANPKPGDTLEVYLAASDQDTINGPKLGQSASIRLKIWSPQEKHDELVEEIAELVDTMLDLLADRLETPLENAKEKTWKPGLETAKLIYGKTNTFLDTLEQLLLSIREDPLMPLEVVDELKALRARHQENNAAEGQLIRRIVKSKRILGRENARLIYVQNEEQVEGLEKDILLVEDLVNRLRQDKLLDQTRDLMTQQNELMRLLDALKEEPNSENTAQAEAVVDRLQEQLNAMMQQLAKQSQSMPNEHINPGALDPKGTQADVRDFQNELEEIRRLLAAGDIEGAQKAAEALQQKIAQMMAAMESGFDGLQMAAQSTKAQEELEKVESEIAQVSKEERRILKETNEINEHVREAMETMRRKKLDAFFEEQRDRVREIRDKLGQVREDPMDIADQEKLNRLKDAARDLEDRLNREDLESSDEQAEQVAKECMGIGNNMGEMASRSNNRRTAKSLESSAKKVAESAELAEKIAKDIRDLNPNPRDFLSKEDEKKLSNLGKAQAKNRQRLKQLQKDVKKMDEVGPALEGAFSELMEGASGAMDKAQQKLGEGRPRVAAQEEEKALDRLGRAQKRIQQMMKPGQGPGMRRTGHRDQDTGIPDPEDYAVPADFRNKVLKAMKGNAPRKYKGQIESYYQELMR